MDVSIENSVLLDELLKMYAELLKENLLLKQVVKKLTEDRPSEPMYPSESIDIPIAAP
jgi:hypothetical protein